MVRCSKHILRYDENCDRYIIGNSGSYGKYEAEKSAVYSFNLNSQQIFSMISWLNSFHDVIYIILIMCCYYPSSRLIWTNVNIHNICKKIRYIIKGCKEQKATQQINGHPWEALRKWCGLDRHMHKQQPIENTPIPPTAKDEYSRKAKWQIR